VAGVTFNRAAVATVGRGQLASRLALRGETSLWCADAWLATECKTETRRAGSAAGRFPLVLCQPDWPAGPFDMVAIPLVAGGQEELALETLETAWLSLRPGGQLLAAIPSASASWLRKSLEVFTTELAESKNSEEPARRGAGKKQVVVFQATSTGTLKRHRNWQCQLAFRDQGRLIHLVTRPGVFSHRELDNGARQLLNAAQVAPGWKVLDIGCGSGAVALGIAARDPSVQVLAVDCHTRAIQCTELGRELNGLANVRTLLSHDGNYGEAGSFDLAVANPPYFSGYRIAELFCTAAARQLKPGGQLLLVTKMPDWFSRRLPDWFDDVSLTPAGRYFIAAGRARTHAGG
jgi:16S rRNA (guanine1207-N2)-methyltransferase